MLGMPPITVRLSDEAAGAIHAAANDCGVSTTGLIEALGLMLSRYPDWSEFPDWPREIHMPPLKDSSLAKLARQVDFDRRQRGSDLSDG